MEDKQIATTEDSPFAMDVLGADQVKKQFARLQDFVKSQMVGDRDFGVIPGCKKPSLWKPGAEKLLFFHGLGCKLESTSETIADWTKGFFNYCYRATVYSVRTGNVIATAEGSCNSLETKYAKQESRNIVNTLQKMAQKRAMVGATLMACRASDIFTDQDPDADPKEGEKKAAGAPASGGGTISEPQRKRLWAIMKEAGVEEEALAQHLREKYAYTIGEDDQPHSSKIKWGNDYNAIVNWLEGHKKKA